MIQICFNHKHAYRLMLGILCAIVISCGQKSVQESGESMPVVNKSSESTIEWYSIPDAGLLSTELKSDSLKFQLMVGAGESCTGEVSGIAIKQQDGTFHYGDKDCLIIFKPTATGITLEESGDLCDHGVHCSFQGVYSKVASEKVIAANADLLSWMRRNINSFSCMLEKQYASTSEKYPCGQTVSVEYNPKVPTWNEGPEFPQDKVKAIHPLIKSISVEFEHGELYKLVVTLNEKMILQDVQKMFNLPNAFDNYENKNHSNVMSLTFDNYNVDEKLEFSLNPVFVTSFTLMGFEHMGEGDIEEGYAEPLLESSIYYEYRETGNVFTLIDEGGPGPYEFTCTSIAKIKTSSTLDQGKPLYSAGNLNDFKESSAWVEGKDGVGVGEWIEFTLTDAYKKWGYTNEDFISKALNGGFVIQTGYAKSPDTWKKNSRPIKLKCYYNGTPISIIQLKDTPDFQTFGVFPEGYDYYLKEGDVIRFEILDVVKGSTYEDTCISEFHIEGSCG